MQGLAVSSVSSSVAIFLKELLSLLLHLRIHDHRTLGPDAKQHKAALQHIWEGPGLKQRQDKGTVCRDVHWQFCGEMHEPNMSVGMSSWVSPLMSPNQPTHIAAPSTSSIHCSSRSAVPSDLIVLHLNHT